MSNLYRLLAINSFINQKTKVEVYNKNSNNSIRIRNNKPNKTNMK